MIVTVDTNVIFSALYSNKGASHCILRLILDEKINLAISTQIYFEYYDVLIRKSSLKQLNLSVSEIEDILDLLALLSQKYHIYYLLRPNLPDESDNIFVECAFASDSKYLITGNIKDFKKSELKGFNFKLVMPGEFYKLWSIKNE
ncbi:MAG: putative toxin-antitoxin system toxin component, PIN family [Calditrichaceae bacterium]|nr:putative toxin-antitoxin system toxin component, PIN family [Calditrichaceae bacterium]MBN2709775.1 putative toxin-antitoxin system toxin component, PIN family [Calditrichaceae bacterium]RQV94969.1 MAG: putative toxin-antitoxin system toxin component, PIN family [Calditrichota bacterium]